MGKAILLGSLLVVCACGGGKLFNLTIDIEGDGTVSFSRRSGAEPRSGTCPDECEDDFTGNDLFMGWDLTASPADGWEFDRWQDCSLQLGAETDLAIATTNGRIACTAIFIPCDATDPRDLADDPDGDATLDLRCVTASILDDNRTRVRVRMEASWEPPPVYSWYTTVTLRSDSAELGSRTEELHDGVRDTITEGMVTEANSTLEVNPGGVPGYAMVFHASITDSIRFIDVETGILKTEAGIFRMDGAITLDF